MGNTSDKDGQSECNRTNDDTKLDQNDCTHGYNDGEYDFLDSDRLGNVHHKNEYNEALSGDRVGSGNAIGVVQDVYTVHTEPDKIADACNDCEIKVADTWRPTGTSDYAFDAQYEHNRGTFDSHDSGDRSTNDTTSSTTTTTDNDLGSQRWQHRPDSRD